MTLMKDIRMGYQNELTNITQLHSEPTYESHESPIVLSDILGTPDKREVCTIYSISGERERKRERESEKRNLSIINI